VRDLHPKIEPPPPKKGKKKGFQTNGQAARFPESLPSQNRVRKGPGENPQRPGGVKAKGIASGHNYTRGIEEKKIKKRGGGGRERVGKGKCRTGVVWRGGFNQAS